MRRVLGASKPEQIRDNVAALDLALTGEHRAALDRASALEPAFPYLGFTDDVKRSIFGGASVEGWSSSSF